MEYVSDWRTHKCMMSAEGRQVGTHSFVTCVRGCIYQLYLC
jgi:hypothetical protein